MSICKCKHSGRVSQVPAYLTPLAEQFSNLSREELDHSCWASRKQHWEQVSHSWKLSGQVCRESGGSGIDVRPVLHSIQESHGKVKTRLGWACQVAETLHILGMWFRQTPLGVPPHTADSVYSHWKQPGEHLSFAVFLQHSLLRKVTMVLT